MIFEVRADRVRDCMGMLMTEQNLAKRLIHPSKMSFLRDTENEREKNYFWTYFGEISHALCTVSRPLCTLYYDLRKPPKRTVKLIEKSIIVGTSQKAHFL